jgi:transcriptional regulator with XRE-family HTH domain
VTTFADAAREALAARGMTQIQLARALGLNTKTVGNWLTGRVTPALHAVDSVGAILGEAPVRAALAERRARCALRSCGRVFYRRDARQTYCRARCAGKAAERRRTKRHAFTRTQERDQLRSAIASFCRTCEPAGVCHDRRCALRVGCPFPVRELSTARPPEYSPGVRPVVIELVGNQLSRRENASDNGGSPARHPTIKGGAPVTLLRTAR